MIKSKIKIRSKYVPDGIKILYEDRDIIIIDKSSGLLSVKARYEKEKTAHQLLINYVRKGNPKARIYLFVVHRLDRETSGVMVFTKSYELREPAVLYGGYFTPAKGLLKLQNTYIWGDIN